MAKKSLKAALSSHQARLQKNVKAKEAAEARNVKASTQPKGKGKGKAKALPERSSIIPFTTQDTILLIGEGNFSFALSLFKHRFLKYLPGANVTATAYDSEEECYAKYPDAKAIVAELKDKGAEVLFDVDATALEKYKQFKGKVWDRIVWNFPHAGKGIADQDRNILSNQMLLLGFLRSAAPFLRGGPVPGVMRSRKRKGGDSDSEEEAPSTSKEVPSDALSEDEDEALNLAIESQSRTRGTILITLRNVPPYTEWNLPRLAKNPPDSSKVSANSGPNPRYIQLRSFIFRRQEWPGYSHRMTKGERAHGTGTTGAGGEDRTWEFCLRDDST